MDTVDFLGIGAQKGGTTWLFLQLLRHPQVAFPRGKEMHYWNRHPSPQADEWVRLLQPALRRTPDGRPVRTGEITPAYAILPDEPIRAIHDRCPDLRLFMSLRNPIARSWSMALMDLTRLGMRLEETGEEWFLEKFRSEGSRRRGDYAGCLERWWSVFPRERLLVLFLDDIARRPTEALCALAAHLGIEPADFAAVPAAALDEVVVPAIGREAAVAPLPPSLFGPLLELHGDDIERLERLLDRDFAEWREPPPPPPARGRVETAWAATPDEALARRHALVGPPDLWEMKRRFQIGFLRGVGLAPGHRLLDLGYGSLRGGIPLIGYLDVGNYTGVEVRREALAEGRRELEEHGLEGRRPRLVHTTGLAGLDLHERFDVVWAFSVLIHLSDGILDDAIACVVRHLGRDGVLYANVHLGTDQDGVWQGFPVVRRPWPFYEAAFARHGLAIEDLGPLTAFGYHHPRLSPERQERQRMLKAVRR